MSSRHQDSPPWRGRQDLVFIQVDIKPGGLPPRDSPEAGLNNLESPDRRILLNTQGIAWAAPVQAPAWAPWFDLPSRPSPGVRFNRPLALSGDRLRDYGMTHSSCMSFQKLGLIRTSIVLGRHVIGPRISLKNEIAHSALKRMGVSEC